MCFCFVASHTGCETSEIALCSFDFSDSIRCVEKSNVQKTRTYKSELNKYQRTYSCSTLLLLPLLMMFRLLPLLLLLLFLSIWKETLHNRILFAAFYFILTTHSLYSIFIFDYPYVFPCEMHFCVRTEQTEQLSLVRHSSCSRCSMMKTYWVFPYYKQVNNTEKTPHCMAVTECNSQWTSLLAQRLFTLIKSMLSLAKSNSFRILSFFYTAHGSLYL